MHPHLILASSSPYRRELLERLHLRFDVLPPGVDETRHPGEPAPAMAARLAREKAMAVAQQLDPQAPALVIGSDQTVACGADVLGKPGSHDKAVEQLSRLSGQEIGFHTGLCLLSLAPRRRWEACVPVHVRFRELEPETIDAYVRQEQPFGCAGAFQVEGYGITLVETITSDDPTALIGLPLIRLSHMLREAGVLLP